MAAFLLVPSRAITFSTNRRYVDLHGPVQRMFSRIRLSLLIGVVAAISLELLSRFGGYALTVHGAWFVLALPAVVLLAPFKVRDEYSMTFTIAFFVANFASWSLFAFVIGWIIDRTRHAWRRGAT